jgi:hypothetical protein
MADSVIAVGTADPVREAKQIRTVVWVMGLEFGTCRGGRSRHGHREAREQVMGSLFGGIEIAGVDHVDHGVGRLGQFVELVLPLEIAGRGGPARRRKRTTPPSLRFLGRRVYLATVVTLISALLLGVTPTRLARLSVVPGIDRRTLARWRAWWRSTFTDGRFASIAMAAVAPPIDITGLPVSLLERFAGDVREQLVALLRFLGPLTGGGSAMRAF